MNQKSKLSTSFIKQPNSYSTSPRVPRKVLLCHKATSTTEKYPSRKQCTDQDCQTDQVVEQAPLQRDYMEALRYINECHEMMNQMSQQTRNNLRIPEVPNFIDLYMHCNNNRTMNDIANQEELQQNISQTHCTLIDSRYDDSVNTNQNYQDYSSPESDYELLAEPLKTYNKKQADIERARYRPNPQHVLQESHPDESNCLRGQNKHLDVLYENNMNWRVSNHTRRSQHTNTSTDTIDQPIRTKPPEKAEMSTLDFENIVEELAQHASQKYSKKSNNIEVQQPNCINQGSRSLSPMACKLARNTSPYEREEYYDNESACPFEPRKQHSNNSSSMSHRKGPDCCRNKSTLEYQVPASKLLQKSHEHRTEQEYHMKQLNHSDNSTQSTCIREVDVKQRSSDDKIPFYKTTTEVESPNSLEKLLTCKKKRSKDIVRRQHSDSDIDDDYFKEERASHTKKNMQRTCVNDAEECRAVIRPNKTELISTVKYGRKVVMRTELAPSEHPNFRQQRQNEDLEGSKCGGDSSDISSDPEFSMRQ